MNTIEVEHVTKAFGKFKAVDDLSLTVPSGTIFGLLGPNGAGKTTTIRMIMDITAPDSGSIRVLGAPAGRESLARVGYLPEERGLYRRMRVIDHLLFLAAIKEVDAETAKQRIERWLDAMELRPWLKKRVEELSKGMQQKIQFIATIVHDPKILILDEVFSGLDPINTALIKEYLSVFRSKGKTIVFSTHVLEQAEKLCDEVCLLVRSKKILEGNLKELKRTHAAGQLRISLAASPAEVSALPGVATAIPVNGAFVVTLQDGVDRRDFLKRAIDRHDVTSFSDREPELEEIYLAAVQRAGIETRTVE